MELCPFDSEFVEFVGIRSGALARLKSGDLGHVLGVQTEAKDVDVLPNPLWRDRLWQHDVAQLNLPAHHHLGRGAAVLAGDRPDDRVVDKLPGPQRAPAFGQDAELGVNLAKMRLG